MRPNLYATEHEYDESYDYERLVVAPVRTAGICSVEPTDTQTSSTRQMISNMINGPTRAEWSVYDNHDHHDHHEEDQHDRSCR